MRFVHIAVLAAWGSAAGCGALVTKQRQPEPKRDLGIVEPWVDPEAHYPRGKQPPKRGLAAALVNEGAPTIAITNATIMTATGATIESGTIVVGEGWIRAIGSDVPVPEDAVHIDGKGHFVTPGIIDAHSHIGVYAAPHVRAHSDGNEMVAPVTGHARAQYGYWPQDPAITRARAGGVTTALVLPGSANLVGGRGFTVVMRPGASAGDVAFPAAAPTVKLACGENPKRVYGDKGGPQTRMGVYAAFRAAFHEAAEYAAKRVAYRQQRALWLEKKRRAEALFARTGERIEADDAPEPPSVDLGLETLAGILRGDVLVHIHCYRAGEIREMVAIADEFGFSIRAFHHALGAYKVRGPLVDRDIAIATWADWWGFKMEAFDGIPENAALFHESGGRAVIHSDSSIGIQRLNQEAAKAMYSGRAAGIDISEEEALRWITANPAWALGIEDLVGTIETGKRADLVLWDRHPFSVYAKPLRVIQAGEIVYDRETGPVPTDFELGNSAVDGARRADGGAR